MKKIGKAKLTEAPHVYKVNDDPVVIEKESKLTLLLFDGAPPITHGATKTIKDYWLIDEQADRVVPKKMTISMNLNPISYSEHMNIDFKLFRVDCNDLYSGYLSTNVDITRIATGAFQYPVDKATVKSQQIEFNFESRKCYISVDGVLAIDGQSFVVEYLADEYVYNLIRKSIKEGFEIDGGNLASYLKIELEYSLKD